MRWSFIQAVSSFLISVCLISVLHLSKCIPFPVKSPNVFDLLDRHPFISLGNNNDEGDDYDGEIDVDQEDKEEKNDSDDDDDDDDVGEERGR